MSLQIALILLGLVALGLVIFFSYTRGAIRFKERFGRLLNWIQFLAPFARWFRSETVERPRHREPSLVSASDFRFDPNPGDSDDASLSESGENVRRQSVNSMLSMEAEDELDWPLKIDYWARIPGSVPVTRNGQR